MRNNLAQLHRWRYHDDSTEYSVTWSHYHENTNQGKRGLRIRADSAFKNQDQTLGIENEKPAGCAGGGSGGN